MKPLYTFILVLFLTSMVSAQCPTGSVFLSSQAEIDDFVATYPNCTQIDGDLSIGSSFAQSSTEPLDLTGLSSLNEVAGFLTIYSTQGADMDGNPIPGSLEGLENIESVENLYVGNPSIFTPSLLRHYESLDPLNGLSGQIGELFITDVSIETELPSFENLTSITYYRQDRVLGITSSPTFPNLNHLEDLTITGSPIPFEDSLFTTVVIPPLLDSIGIFDFPQGGLYIFDTWNVSETQGGENLTFISNAFFERNFSLADLSALSNVTDLGGGLSIESGVPEIFNSFQNLQNIEQGGQVNLTFNELESPFEECSELTDEIVIGISSGVVGNVPEEFPLNIVANCVENVSVTGNFEKLADLRITAYQATNVTGFASLDSIVGDSPNGQNNLFLTLPNVTNLPSFENLVHVEDDVQINSSSNWLLEDMSGLEALNTIGGSFNLTSGPAGGGDFLTSLSGLENLSSVGGTVRLRNQIALSDISALNNLEAAGALNLLNLPSLTLTPELSSLSSCGNITIDETGLSNLPAFTSLTTLEGDLRITDNPSLTAVDGFVSLEEIGDDITISGNSMLAAVSLPSEISFAGELTVSDNPMLENCGASVSICNLVSQASAIDFMGNGTNCSAPADVLASCAVLSANEVESEALTARTAGKHILVTAPRTIKNARIDIYSIDGKRIFSERWEILAGESILAYPSVPEGIYFLRIESEGVGFSEKLFLY